MRYFCLFILSLFLSLPTIAQTTFEVRSSESDESISEAQIKIADQKETGSTDTNGKAIVALDEKESYDLMVFAFGYRLFEGTISISNRDTTILVLLKPIEVEIEEVNVNGQQRGKIQALNLNDVEGMQIFAGKKSQVLSPSSETANLATNNSREIYAKVPGLNIWESLGSGLATEIGGRGLSPIRSSNFNVRQNGYDISADALGYPDAYYVPPAEVVDQIQVLRGAASLQYGTQFGGMVNYKIAEPDPNVPLELKAKFTGGSYGFANIDLGVEANIGNVSLKNNFQFKRGNGWRPNSGFNAGFNFAQIGIQINPKLKLKGEYTYFNYLAQQPGGLSDALYAQNPRHSIRERNWFQVKWNLPSLSLYYKASNRFKLETTFFGLIASRDAVGFLGNITRVDPLEERDLLRDTYLNFGNETRTMFSYYNRGLPQVWLIGARVFRGETTKKQGLGTDGYDADFNYLNPDNLEGSDYNFPSWNVSLFTEHIFRISKYLSITPGLRFEYINTNAEGYYRVINEDLAGNVLLDTSIYESKSSHRAFVIGGIGLAWQVNGKMELYGNFSQNYRAINFNDLRINNSNFRVDPNLEDERGFTADVGLRGTLKDLLTYDISVFYLHYANRIGFTLETDTTLFNTYRYRTNIAQSRTIGFESVLEIDWMKIKNRKGDIALISLFNLAFTNGRYVKSKEAAFDGNRVELIPAIAAKTRLDLYYKNFSIGTQFSFTGKQFSDASNAEFVPDAVGGIIPAYYILDLSTTYTWNGFTFSVNINNLTNNTYFTRRAAGYPGPGILLADGIGVFGGIEYTFQK